MTQRVELRIGDVLVARVWQGEPRRPGAKAVCEIVVRATSTGLENVSVAESAEAMIEVSPSNAKAFDRFIGRSQTERLLEKHNAEELARERASEAFHDDPSRPGDCETYQKHYRRSCPCERDWRHYLGKEDE